MLGGVQAVPYGAKISIDIVSLTAGEALTPLGAFALSQIGSIVVDLAHKAMDSKVEKDVDAIQWD
jgi:transcriptional regulator, merR family